MKQRQDCAKSFDEQMRSQFIEQEETVKNILECLKKKEAMCADMFNEISQKVPETKQKKQKMKRKSEGQRRNLKRLLS